MAIRLSYVLQLRRLHLNLNIHSRENTEPSDSCVSEIKQALFAAQERLPWPRYLVQGGSRPRQTAARDPAGAESSAIQDLQRVQGHAPQTAAFLCPSKCVSSHAELAWVPSLSTVPAQSALQTPCLLSSVPLHIAHDSIQWSAIYHLLQKFRLPAAHPMLISRRRSCVQKGNKPNGCHFQMCQGCHELYHANF